MKDGAEQQHCMMEQGNVIARFSGASSQGGVRQRHCAIEQSSIIGKWRGAAPFKGVA